MTPPPFIEDVYEIPMCSICTQTKMVECKGCGNPGLPCGSDSGQVSRRRRLLLD